MSRIYVFADESGNLDFSRNQGATTYFSLTTITPADCHALSADLGKLRLHLAWEGIPHPGPFHANNDPRPVRDRVFGILEGHEFRVDATLLEKSKAKPRIRPTEHRFYHYAWYLHMKYVAPRIAGSSDELLVVAASIGTKKKRSSFFRGVLDVMGQVSPTTNLKTACWPAEAESCLQAADYCAWAIGRKWQQGDEEPYGLIAHKIASEFNVFGVGSTHYY